MNKTADMVYWITERERMRVRRENADRDDFKFGYSDDPHMGTVRYCNVRREDDKVTKWLAKHWRPDHHAVWEIVLARMINYIPSLDELLGCETLDPDRAAEVLKVVRAEGEKVFTSAYTISTCGQRIDKIDYVMGVVADVKRMGVETVPAGATLADYHRWLMKVKGLGSFLAAQVVADLKNTAGHALRDAPDWHTWAAHGPGSLNGLEAYFGHRVPPSGFTAALAQAWQDAQPLLGDDLQDLHMQDFQNCLCEFSKYIRVKEDNGHARNRYTAG